MTEEEKVVTGQVEDMTQDYVAAIKELKENSVDRSKYDALKAENKKLLSSLINGEDIGSQPVEEKESIEDLRRKVFHNPDQTNLEYVTNVLKLREAIMEEGHPDPFVASSSQYTPTLVDYDTANRVATVLQEMVDVADGNPDVFLNEYQRRVRETNIPRKK